MDVLSQLWIFGVTLKSKTIRFHSSLQYFFFLRDGCFEKAKLNLSTHVLQFSLKSIYLAVFQNWWQSKINVQLLPRLTKLQVNQLEV